MKNVKILEKTMTKQELLEYIESHPKWRIPTFDECKDIQENTKLSEDKNFRVNDGTVAVCMLYAEGEVLAPIEINNSIKMDVILIQSLESCVDTGTVLYVECSNEKELEKASLEYGRPYLKEALQKHNTNFLNSVVNAMSPKDFAIFARNK
jgi:hypothetical protein